MMDNNTIQDNRSTLLTQSRETFGRYIGLFEINYTNACSCYVREETRNIIVNRVSSILNLFFTEDLRVVLSVDPIPRLVDFTVRKLRSPLFYYYKPYPCPLLFITFQV